MLGNILVQAHRTFHCFKHVSISGSTYLYDVKDDVFVEAVQDTFGYTVVVPSSMDQQKILQVFELCGEGGRRESERVCFVYTVHTVSDGA